MIARIQSYLLHGIDALPCEIEVDFDEKAPPRENGAPPPTILVGLPDAGVKESQERVRSAMFNTGFTYPNGRVVINLAPADVRKEGPVYDLAIAVGLLVVSGVVPSPEPTPSAPAASPRPAVSPPSLTPSAMPPPIPTPPPRSPTSASSTPSPFPWTTAGTSSPANSRSTAGSAQSRV